MHLVGGREGLLPECSTSCLELRRLKLKHTWQLTACLRHIINGSLPTGSTISITTIGGSAGIRNLYSYVTSSGDIRYDNRSYAAIVQRKSRVRGQISAPSVPSCVCANELSFKICVFQVVKSPQSRRDRCYCYRRHVRTL